MKDWYENPDFWETMRPAIFGAKSWDSAAEQVESIIGLLGLERGMRVLDLCSGPGRHALELERRGYRVTAVDLHAAYLEELRAKGTSIEIVRCDMREFRREAEFDAALNLWTSFGYFRDPADDLRVLGNLRASLRAGGKVILDLLGKEVLAPKFRERNWDQLEDGSILLHERKLQDGWRAVLETWTLIRGTARKAFTVFVRLYSGAEIAALLEETGFSDVRLYGSRDGSPYDHEAKLLVAVASA